MLKLLIKVIYKIKIKNPVCTYLVVVNILKGKHVVGWNRVELTGQATMIQIRNSKSNACLILAKRILPHLTTDITFSLIPTKIGLAAIGMTKYVIMNGIQMMKTLISLINILRRKHM